MPCQDCDEVHDLKPCENDLYSKEYNEILKNCPCKECLVKMICILGIYDCDPYFEHWANIQEYLNRPK